MNCEELRGHYDFYALDLAEEPERGEIRAHLNRKCEVCMEGVRRALETAALVGASAPPAEPSGTLRRRVLASVGVVPRRLNWTLAWVAAAAVAAMLVVVIYTARSAQRSTEFAAAQSAEVARMTQALAILNGPRTQEVSFGGPQPRPPQGKVFVNPARGVLLIASNLPRTPADKIYEMWLIPKGAKPVPAGLFQSENDGSAMHVRPGTVDVASTAAVAVTVENEAGAAQPTTTPLIVAALNAAQQ